MSADPEAIERYARDGIHAARLSSNAEKARPFVISSWELRSPDQQEQDRRAASAVAAMAVHDAGLKSHEDAIELARFRAHLPVILDALSASAASAEYESLARPYKAALEALGAGKEAGHA